MSDALIVGILSAAVSLIGIIATVLATRNALLRKIDITQQLMNNEMEHIKENQTEMKADLKTHNHYAQLFNENIPVIKEQIKVANHRIDDLESVVTKHITG